MRPKIRRFGCQYNQRSELPRKRNFPLFHHPTMTDSAAFCTETRSHHDRSSMQCWLTPQSVVQNVAHCFLDFLFWYPVLHRRLLPCEKMRCVYVPSHVYHTHFLSLQTVNNPLDSVSRQCNTNRNLSSTLSLHSNTKIATEVKGFDNKHLRYVVYDATLLLSSAWPTPTNKFPKCQERFVKVV
jgi:hypothetical protein